MNEFFRRDIHASCQTGQNCQKSRLLDHQNKKRLHARNRLRKCTGERISLNWNRDALRVFWSIRVFFVAVCGFERGMHYIQEHLRSDVGQLNVHFCDPLDESDSCFRDQSKVFPDQNERSRAREIAETRGTLLCKPAPLGYSDSEALVVFSHNCPNNTLPILWEKNRDWIPPFRRD